MSNSTKIFLSPGTSMSNQEISEWNLANEKYTKKFEISNAEKKSVFTFFEKEKINNNKFVNDNDCAKFHTTMWKDHLERIEDIFFNDPVGLLCDDLVRYAIYLTTGGQFVKTEIPYLEKRIEKKLLCNLLRENNAYKQTIIHGEYLTSESRVHHLTHLIYLEELCHINLSKIEVFIEFGGGYGSMTDLVKRLNPNMTQIVIDFPIMLLVQYYYLLFKYGESDVNLIKDSKDKIIEGKINLIPVNLVENFDIEKLCPNIFCATWSLSEANKYTQNKFIKNYNFFNAGYVFYGYRKFIKTNPRQPCSKELNLTGYKTLENKASFWALNNEHFYQVLSRVDSAIKNIS